VPCSSIVSDAIISVPCSSIVSSPRYYLRAVFFNCFMSALISPGRVLQLFQDRVTICGPCSSFVSDATICVPCSSIVSEATICVPCSSFFSDATICVPCSSFVSRPHYYLRAVFFICFTSALTLHSCNFVQNVLNVQARNCNEATEMCVDSCPNVAITVCNQLNFYANINLFNRIISACLWFNQRNR
jgi:hypothetical protein